MAGLLVYCYMCTASPLHNQGWRQLCKCGGGGGLSTPCSPPIFLFLTIYSRKLIPMGWQVVKRDGITSALLCVCSLQHILTSPYTLCVYTNIVGRWESTHIFICWRKNVEK